MTHITLTEAQQHLSEIIAGLTPGETIQIFQDDRPIARLIIEIPTLLKPRKPGSAIGTFTIVSDDDDHLQDFNDDLRPEYDFSQMPIVQRGPGRKQPTDHQFKLN